MKDMLLEIGKNPSARRIIKTLGLPIPLPEPLRRKPGAMPARPLEDRKIIVGGVGDLGAFIAEALASTGAAAAPADARADGLVFDASSISNAGDLRAVFDFFQPLLSRVARSGRILILARPSAGLSPEAAAAQAALDGFNRSIAKEIGRIGATANMLWIEPGAERRAIPVIRFALSAKSAFITAQPIAITGRAKAGDDPSPARGLHNKIALVTGAARGIGAATARALAGEGAHVICLDRPADEEATSQIAREIGGTPLLVDLTEPGAIPKILEAVSARGGVDIVVHNAGITRDKTLARMSPELWDQVLDVNLGAVIRVHQAIEPHLRDDGRVIGLSSIAGLAGNVGQTAYAASKAGIAGFVAAAAERLSSRGITVNAVAPGFIETRLTAAIPFAIREVARRLAALGQGGLPEDVADAIAFLATPGSQGITGTTLRVCGGAFIGR